MRMGVFLVIGIVVSLASNSFGAEPVQLDPDFLAKEFSRAEERYGVPARLLMAIAFEASQWTNLTPEKTGGRFKPIYGVMGLKIGNWFSDTLSEAAQLSQLPGEDLAQTQARLKSDPASNIDAAAKLLQSYAFEHGLKAINDPEWKANPLKWAEAVRRFSGIPASGLPGLDDTELYLYEIYSSVGETMQFGDTRIAPVPIDVPSAFKAHLENLGIVSSDHTPKAPSQASPNQPPKDWCYLPATRTTPQGIKDVWASRTGSGPQPGDMVNLGLVKMLWEPTPNCRPGRLGEKPEVIIIHDMEGGFSGTISWFKNPDPRDDDGKPVDRTSAHFLIRSRDGFIAKMVRELDTALHVRSANFLALGIEHEGFATPQSRANHYYTEAMYKSSAKLVSQLAKTYDIPKDPAHIFGHDVNDRTRDPNSPFTKNLEDNPLKQRGVINALAHHDPGIYWNWEHHYELFGGTFE